MANRPRKKAAASKKASPKRAASPRKSSAGGPPLWLMFTGLVAAVAVVYFVSRHAGSPAAAGPEQIQEKVSKMAEENPDAEIFQMKEEPVQKVSEKKK